MLVALAFAAAVNAAVLAIALTPAQAVATPLAAPARPRPSAGRRSAATSRTSPASRRRRPRRSQLWERLPRLRDRLRDRRARAAGGPPRDARGAGAGQRRSTGSRPNGDLGSGASVDVDRRPRVGLRLGPRATLVGLRRLRRRLLRRRWRRRRRRRRRVWLRASMAPQANGVWHLRCLTPNVSPTASLTLPTTARFTLLA